MAFFQLARLLEAGISLGVALEEIASASGSRAAQRLWASIACSVCAGKDLSESISIHIVRPDATVMALLKAGEARGKLSEACENVKDHLQWQNRLRQRLITLLIYPLFALLVTVAVTGFMFLSVVPSIKRFLLSTGGELAWHTYALMGTSDWLVRHYLPAAALSAALLLTMILCGQFSPRARHYMDQGLLKLPLVGQLIARLSLSRYSGCCAQLYHSGVALERALQLAEATVENRALKADLAKARLQVVGGQSLAVAIALVSVFPPIVARMISVGESSGDLAHVLTTVGQQQGESADAAIKRLEQLIGPVLMMIIGAVLLWIVVSMLAPVYNLAITTVIES